MVDHVNGEDLIKLRQPTVCDKCGEQTIWRRPRQSKKGFCPDHAWFGTRTLVEAVNAVIDAFPGCHISQEPPHYMEPGEYAKWVRVVVEVRTVNRTNGVKVARRFVTWTLPPDAGPCTRCGVLIRLYGPEALTLCAPCARAAGLISSAHFIHGGGYDNTQ